MRLGTDSAATMSAGEEVEDAVVATQFGQEVAPDEAVATDAADEDDGVAAAGLVDADFGLVRGGNPIGAGLTGVSKEERARHGLGPAEGKS